MCVCVCVVAVQREIASAAPMGVTDKGSVSSYKSTTTVRGGAVEYSIFHVANRCLGHVVVLAHSVTHPTVISFTPARVPGLYIYHLFIVYERPVMPHSLTQAMRSEHVTGECSSNR